MNHRRIYCALPWYSLQLHFSGTYGPCCHVRFDTDVLPDHEGALMTLFNSEKMIDLRQGLTSGDVGHLPCRSCYDRYFDTDHDIFGMGKSLPLYSRHDDRFAQRYAVANQGYRSGHPVCSHAPLELYVYTSERCNLNCIMCDQNRRPDEAYPIHTIIALIEQIGWQNLDRFGWVGGESLLTDDGRGLLEYVAQSKTDKACIYITTNGSTIHEVSDRLRAIDNLFLTISMEGVGDVYESIRRQGSWHRLMKNLRLLHRISKQKEQWRLNIHSVVMKSSIGSLVEILELAHSIEASAFFYPIQNYYRNENLFIFSDLMEFARATDRIETAKAFARAQRQEKASDSLEKVGLYLADARQEGLRLKTRIDDLCQLLGDADVIVYGAGGHTELLLDGFRLNRLNIVALADKDPGKQGRTRYGFRVIPPDDIPRQATDVVISSKIYEREIVDGLRQSFGDRVRLYPLYH